MDEIEIIDTTTDNIGDYPPKCFLNPKNEGYLKKLEWLRERFSEGLKIKQLYSEKERKCIGFIEYVPGEYAWRAVDAEGYMFIHCMWISQNKYKGKGYGSDRPTFATPGELERCDAEEDGRGPGKIPFSPSLPGYLCKMWGLR